MIVCDEDLNCFVREPKAFERLIHSLIRDETRACNIAPDQIDWDYRVTVGDGGRDVLIRVGNQRADRLYIPNVQSVWSVKSGQDGLETSKFSKEIYDHPKVISHLKGGGDYFSCIAPAADGKKRDALRKTAAALAKKHGFNKEQIHFYFRDNLTSWVNQHLGLIPIHFPHLPKGWMPLLKWRKTEKYLSVPWVNFGARTQLVDTIRTHLKSTNDSNVIHLAGWSGIGKTRTVLQACEDPALESVLYFSSLEAFTGFEQHLTRNNGIHAALVIDEVPIEELSSLQSRLADFQNRLRVVTIGAGVKDSAVSRNGVIMVPEPDSATDVVAVIQSANPSLLTEQAWNIANWSDHDLRLALLLTEADKNDPTFTQHPFASVEDVWKRVLSLFISEITDQNEFTKNYQLLSITLDIGNKDERRDELHSLAQFFSVPISSLDRTIALACQCGLGRQQGRFFEATPRALARRIFERWSWSIVKNDFTRFFSDLPTDRVRRRVMEGAQECSREVRESVAQALNDWFRNRFPTNDLTLISSREDSRVFCEYGETAPISGLAWLKQTVERATPEQLLAFDGKSDWTGYWRGRRQAVWLCEHLAQFDDHFWDCEAILFRLAQYETEDRVSNNSTGTWRGLFLPLYSWTSLSFDSRWKHLMRRLSNATDAQSSLILQAAIDALKEPSGRFVPPTVVGGTPVPPEWRPTNENEYYKIAADAALSLIEQIQALPDHREIAAKAVVIDHTVTFLRLGCLEKLREWLTPQNLSEKMLRDLRASLDDHIDWLEKRTKDHPEWDFYPTDDEKRSASQRLEEVLPWRQSMNPQTLEELIRDLTGRSIDGLERVILDTRPYEQLAAETLQSPQVLSKVWDWFNSDDALSSDVFGWALGKQDLTDVLQEPLLEQLAEGRCVNLVAGYFNSHFIHRNLIPPTLVKTLDSIADIYKEIAVFVTLRADVSEAGLERLLRIVPQAKQDTFVWLEDLSRGQVWLQILTAQRQAQIIEMLTNIGESGQSQAYEIAIRLVFQWYPHIHNKVPVDLANVVLTVLRKSLGETYSRTESFYWIRGVALLPSSCLLQKIDLLIDTAMFSFGLREDAEKMLSVISEKYPLEHTQAIEAKIQSADSEDSEVLSKLFGLLDPRQIETIQRLIRELGIVGARAYAQHISAPHPTAENPIKVSPMTAWLLSEFEDDDQVFNTFCLSCHNNGQIYFGNIGRHFIGTEEKVVPYLKHPLRRIREWAQNEINYAKGRIDWGNQTESEEGRT